MSKLFERFTINNLTLKNRFIMSAAADNLQDDRKARTNRFAALSRGEIGLIITGGTRLDKIETFADIVSTVHKNGGKLAIQFVAESGPGIPRNFPNNNEDKIAVSVLPEDHIYFSALGGYMLYGKHHAASEIELAEIIDQYAKAAVMIKKIGADAIQVHAAHQNFLSQMLSPLTNLRTDKWGGSLENRTRLHREIYKAIRAALGNDFPILIKLGVEDKVKGGLTFAEGKEVARIIAEYGYDALEISQGLQDYSAGWDFTPMHMHINKIEDEAYFKTWCKEIKPIVDKPIVLTGGLRSPELMEKLIQNGTTDLIGMCRPFIREPALIKRWQNGNLNRATCISCNKCITELSLHGKPLECYLDKIR